MMSCLHLLVLHLYLSPSHPIPIPSIFFCVPSALHPWTSSGVFLFFSCLTAPHSTSLSSKVTIFHLHMSKPSQPDLYNFICLFVCLFLSLYSYFISLCGDFAFLCSSFSGFASIWCLFTPLVPFLLHLFSGFAFARHWGRHTPWQAQLRAPKPYSSWCILGLYVKPTWQPPAPEHSLRSACLFWSLQQPVGPAPSPTCWGMWARTDPGGRTAPAERGSGPNCSPVCAKGEAGCWAAPSCWVEVWVYIRLWSCPSSSTWPRRRGR